MTLGGGFTTSSNCSVLASGQATTLIGIEFSKGALVYAWVSTTGSELSAPEQVCGITIVSITSCAISLLWTALQVSSISYTVQYRPSGTANWSAAPLVTAPSCDVGGLLSATSYDFVVSASNATGVGAPSSIVSATTLAVAALPGQVAGVATSNASPNGISLTWSSPESGGAPSSYAVQYRVTGTTPWYSGGSGLTSTSYAATGLSSGTSYDFEVFAVNALGSGPASNVETASTTTAGVSVTSITWNVTPSGTYTHGSGAIGVNAQVSPGSVAVQFGFCTSQTVPPTEWTDGLLVNSNLWGAYVATPPVAGTWYAWVEGTDGSMPTVYPSGFLVI